MRDRTLVRGVVVTLTSFLLIVALLLAGLTALSSRNSTELSTSLKASVLHAMLTCYAVEGVYPSDATYLEDYYGLSYDHKSYSVFLDAFADNVLPGISILQIGEGSEK